MKGLLVRNGASSLTFRRLEYVRPALFGGELARAALSLIEFELRVASLKRARALDLCLRVRTLASRSVCLRGLSTHNSA